MIDTRLTHCLWLALYLMALYAVVARADVRRVRYRTWSETVTDYDPEVIEREDLPKERRRGLR